jgi:PAS domain S-box-containing protein
MDTLAEITRQKINERRTAMLDPMSAPSIIQPHCQYILPFLEKNPHDVPMAMVYKVDKDSEPGHCLVLLCGSIGVPSGHPLAVEKADIVSLDGLIPLFREAHSEIITRPVDESFEGIEWKGFQEPSKFFSVMPIKEANCLFGFVVIGANPRRPIDEDHHQFMRDISTKVTSIAASVISAQEYLRHKERLQRELEASERQIRFFAEHASVGMQNLATDAKQVVWANEQFFKITGLPRQIEAVGHKLYFIDVVHPEDREKARETFKRVLSGEENVSAEIRLKRKFQPPFGEPEHACILSLSFPYKEDGKVTSVMTCVTDVSRLKVRIIGLNEFIAPPNFNYS